MGLIWDARINKYPTYMREWNTFQFFRIFKLISHHGYKTHRTVVLELHRMKYFQQRLNRELKIIVNLNQGDENINNKKVKVNKKKTLIYF